MQKAAVWRSVTTPKILRPSDASLLAGMPATARELAAHGVIRSYRARTVLIGEGDQGDAVFVVLLGVLRIFCSTANGREITLALYGPGEYVGEMSLDAVFPSTTGHAERPPR